MRALVRSILVPTAICAALATLWTWPLALHLSTRLPGELAGDNLGFTWNLWWMRQAGTGFFTTDHLFAPFGIDLALHTHTALQAVVGATLLARLDIFTAQNLVILATLALNGSAAYALALDRTRRVVPALVAGLIYASSAYVTTHLLGHFSLIGTWTLPLYVLCLLRTLEGGSLAWALATGLALATTAWTDYYYAVYCVVLTVGAVVHGPREQLDRPVIAVDPHDVAPRVRRTLVALMALLVAVGVAILVTGGVDTTVAGARLRATDTHNVFTGVWMLAATYGWLRFRPRVRLNLRARLPGVVARAWTLWPAVVVALVALLPVDEAPHLYTTLAAMPAGAVCELPMGLRDGFEQRGAFDDRTLQYQFVHGHPLVGGFAARIPESLKDRYTELPVVRSLLRLSAPAGGTLDPRDEALSAAEMGEALRRAGIRFVVVDRTRAGAALQAVVDTRLPLTLVERNETRELFTVVGSEHN